MSSYVGWAITQTAGRLIPWVAANPEKVALYSIALWYERKLTLDITWGAIGVGYRAIVGGTGPGIIQTTARAIATRFPLTSTIYEGGKQLVKKNPIGIAAAGTAALGIAYSETSADVGGFASPASSGIGLSPTTTTGGFDEFWGFGN